MKTRGLALTKIYQWYKTIVVTDMESKNSKVITFKATGANPLQTLTSKQSFVSSAAFSKQIGGGSDDKRLNEESGIDV